jgi:CRISPR-associated protein Cas5d
VKATLPVRTFPVEIEIEGPFAAFANPASGAGFQTYLVPPFSAAQGMFRAIAWLKEGACIRPTQVEICRPLVLTNLTTNYRGPYRKAALVSKGQSQQMAQQVLQDVCYRLHGEVVRVGQRHPEHDPCHYLQDLFNRRLARGQCAYVPHLGLSQFKATYFGCFRPETRVEPLNLTIHHFLMSMYDAPLNGKVKPTFGTAKVVDGVLSYAH